MPGDNCAIFDCSVSRSRKYKGISLYKIPSGDQEFEKKARDQWINIVTKDRVIDASLRDQIKKRKIFICQKHFKPDQILIHDSRTTLKPGEIPCIELPCKKFSSTQPPPRESAEIIELKRQQSIDNDNSSLTEQKCYQSYDEFVNRIKLLKLPPVWTIVFKSSNHIVFQCEDELHSVPIYEIHTNETLQFIIRYFLWCLPREHEIYNTYSRSFGNITVTNLIKELKSYVICPGVTDKCLLTSSLIEHSVPKIFTFQTDESSLIQTKFYRSPLCVILSIENKQCQECKKIESKEVNSAKRKLETLKSPAKLNAPLSGTSTERIKLTLQGIRLENKTLRAELQQMQAEIAANSLHIGEEFSKDLKSIMSNSQRNIPPFMKFFWEEQQKYLTSSKTGVRYHPQIIRYCLSLAAKSPAFYDDIRLDEKNETGFLILPSRRRLRDYKNYIRPQRGFNSKIVEELTSKVKDFQLKEKFVILLLDEMKIQEDLVWDKNTGELIGYVDLGDPELTYTTMKNAGTIASHILVFLICGIVNPIKFSLANFATSNALSTQLFPLFWDAVAILEDKCGLKVMAVTSDGASANRSMYKMLCKMNNVEHINTDVDVGYRVLNHFAEEEEDRYIYLLGDAPHSQKTARNCLYHSGFDDYCSRLMCKDGYFLLWNHIRQLFKEDLECGLHLVPKFTSEHINLSPFTSVHMNRSPFSSSEHFNLRHSPQSVCNLSTTYGPAEA